MATKVNKSDTSFKNRSNLYFFKTWDKILSFFFRYSARCYQRESTSSQIKQKNKSKKNKTFAKDFGIFSCQRPIIGHVTKEFDDLLLTKDLIYQTYESISHPKLHDLVLGEILAKVLAYRTIEQGFELAMGFCSSESEIELSDYVVSKVFNLWQSHVAFGLTPKNPKAPAIILFRGTNFSIKSQDGRASILSDLDPEGPGRKLFEHSESVIRKWIQKQKTNNLHVRAIGFSLGGSLVYYTVYFEHELLSTNPLFPSLAFNPPGVSEDFLKSWHELSSKKRPTINTYITRGDVVAKFGFLLEDTFEVACESPLSPISAHQTLIFSKPVYYLAKIDVQAENSSPTRSDFSKFQKSTTNFAYRCGLKYLFPNPFDI